MCVFVFSKESYALVSYVVTLIKDKGLMCLLVLSFGVQRAGTKEGHRLDFAWEVC